MHAETAGRFVARGESVVADVLKHIPGSLELLIAYGFKPLADPELRERVTPHVTLATACGMHAIDLNVLLAHLNRLAGAEPEPNGVDRQAVLNALRNCHDPEIPVNIVDLGLVCDVRVSGHSAAIKMTLTAPDCPVAPAIIADVTDAVRALGMEEVDVELVRNPPWTPERMSPAARRALGW